MHTPCNCTVQCSPSCDRWSGANIVRNFEKNQKAIDEMNAFAGELYSPKLGVHTPWWKNKRWWERTLYGKCKWCFPIVVVILIYTGYMLGGSQ